MVQVPPDRIPPAPPMPPRKKGDQPPSAAQTPPILSYVRNCEIVTRPSSGVNDWVFFVKPNGEIVARLDGYRITPLEEVARPSARPLEWDDASVTGQWIDTRYGFSITLEEGDAEPYSAAWGEGDSESFVTLERAQAWCREQLDGWVSRNIVLASSQSVAGPHSGTAAQPVVADLLQSMILSATQIVDGETVVGYQIKTGALHKLVGLFPGVFFPAGLPTVDRLKPARINVTDAGWVQAVVHGVVVQARYGEAQVGEPDIEGLVQSINASATPPAADARDAALSGGARDVLAERIARLMRKAIAAAPQPPAAPESGSVAPTVNRPRLDNDI